MMQNLKILNSKETKRIFQTLEKQFGLSKKLDYVFLQNNKDRLYVVNRSMGSIDLEKLRINSIGLYFGTIINSVVRLSIEGSQIIGPLSNKNILELSDEKFNMWLKGEDFEVD